jgi:hypothetical protein
MAFPDELQKQRHVFIGKPLKVWGCLVVLPDPEPNQPEQKKTTKCKGKAITRRGHESKKMQFFIGSLKPLLEAWKWNRRRQRQSMLMDASACTSANNPGDNGDEGANPKDYGDH